MEVTKPCSGSSPRLEFLTILQAKGSRSHHPQFHRNANSWTVDSSFTLLKLSSPKMKQCEALASSDQECDPIQDKNESQQFVVREASLDEDYYRAALLRAETHFEDQPHLRHVNSFKLQFAEGEFTAIKRRTKARFGQIYMCIIMDRKEETDVKQKARKSPVGTVDVYIQKFMPGEAVPWEPIDVHIPPLIKKNSTTYSYVANLCVAKSARRQGVASTMMRLSIKHAKDNGAENVYVHVERSNDPAQELYKQLGFQMVEEEEKTYLLCLKT